MKKLSVRQLKALANEEKKTAKLYDSWGLWRFSRDEARHAAFFKMAAKKMRK